MTAMHRFFVPTADIQAGQVAFSPRQARQLHTVLRLTPGRQVVVLDNTGRQYDVVLTELTGQQAAGRIAGERRAAGEPAVCLTLFQAMLAREKFEWVLQKCTEIGVSRFVPVVTERTIIRDTSIKPAKMGRWRRIITEAAEQSHRGIIPQLETPVPFDRALDQIVQSDLALAAYEDERTTSLKDALQDKPAAPGRIALLIGPEGGLAENEIARVNQRHATPFSLGPRILRTETAAVVAASLVLYETGNMDPCNDNG